MNTLNFEQLYSTDYNLDNIFVMHQYWNNHQIFSTKGTPRRTSALLYFKNSGAIYREKGQELFTLSPGTVVYIPQGSLYETEFLNPLANQPSTILIEFTLLSSDGAPFAASDKIMILDRALNPIMVKLMEETVNIYISPVLSYVALKSTLYQILLNFSRKFHQKNIFSKEFAGIAQGILYMENNPHFDKSIEEIAAMCHVSVSCFRRLFKQYAGVSPMEFKTRARMEYAKKLLQLDYMSLNEIADTLQYEDVAYFCRVFKKQTGCTPSEYAKAMK